MRKLVVTILVVVFILTSCIIYRSNVNADAHFKATKVEQDADTVQQPRRLKLKQ